jgi:hypothetical protein
VNDDTVYFLFQEVVDNIYFPTCEMRVGMYVLINLLSVDAKGIPGKKCRGTLHGSTPRGEDLCSKVREVVCRTC